MDPVQLEDSMRLSKHCCLSPSLRYAGHVYGTEDKMNKKKKSSGANTQEG